MAAVERYGTGVLSLDAQAPAWCCGVALWLVGLHQAPSRAAMAVLSDEERQRAARFHHEADRRRYLAAHVALRERLGQYLGRAPRSLAFHTGSHGKPLLAHGVHPFNLSHSGDLALIGVSDDCEVGVDIEIWREVGDAAQLAQSVFGPQERAALSGLVGDERNLAFLRGWTRKEACLKALGTGLSLSPQGFEAGLGPDACELVLPAATGQETVWVQSIEGPAGLEPRPPWVGAVAKRRRPA